MMIETRRRRTGGRLVYLPKDSFQNELSVINRKKIFELVKEKEKLLPTIIELVGVHDKLLCVGMRNG